MVSCLGSLVLSCFGEGGELQTNLTGVCGEHPQCSRHTGFAPAHGCVLSSFTLLQFLTALYGLGPEFVRFLFSGPSQKRGLGWACVLCLPWPKQLRQPGA